MSLTRDPPPFFHSHALCLSLPVGYKSEWRRLSRRQEDDPLDIHKLIFTHQAVRMDRGMSVSLWCEEVEDQDLNQDQDQDQDQSQSQTEAPAQDLTRGPSQLRAAWDPTVSGHRVIQRLLQVEERYLPSTLYVTLIQRDPERREELAKWALEVRSSVTHSPVLLSILLQVQQLSHLCLLSAGVL